MTATVIETEKLENKTSIAALDVAIVEYMQKTSKYSELNQSPSDLSLEVQHTTGLPLASLKSLLYVRWQGSSKSGKYSA